MVTSSQTLNRGLSFILSKIWNIHEEILLSDFFVYVCVSLILSDSSHEFPIYLMGSIEWLGEEHKFHFSMTFIHLSHEYMSYVMVKLSIISIDELSAVKSIMYPLILTSTLSDLTTFIFIFHSTVYLQSRFLSFTSHSIFG